MFIIGAIGLGATVAGIALYAWGGPDDREKVVWMPTLVGSAPARAVSGRF